MITKERQNLILVVQALNVAGSAEITEKSLSGSLRLVDFNATMSWSKFGELQASYIQVKN